MIYFSSSSYFYIQKNNSISKDLYTIYTGEDDPMLLNTLDKFNGLSSLPWWNDEYANMINGSGTKTFLIGGQSAMVCSSILQVVVQDARLIIYPTIQQHWTARGSKSVSRLRAKASVIAHTLSSVYISRQVTSVNRHLFCTIKYDE